MKSEKVTTRASERWYDDACGTALALELVGERWSLLILRELMFGPRRFGQIKSNLPGISANILTQRLQRLEATEIVTRYRLPSPADVQVYDLTPWGRDSEPMIRDLGRWAARSPRHDPMLFMSPASAMISLKTLVQPERAEGAAMTAAFHMPDDAFVARLDRGVLTIVRGHTAEADVTFVGDTLAMRRSIYGKEGFDREGLLSVHGDHAIAQRFAALFSLPEKNLLT